MKYKTYEADREGRIYVYPSIDGPGGKMPDLLRVFIKRLINILRGKGKELLRKE